MSSEIKADKWSPASGTAGTIGDSGDTFTIPSGVTFANSGTATGFGATLTGSTDNTVVTVTGANAMQGEANLTHDGTTTTMKATAGASTTETAVITTANNANPAYANLVFKTGGNTSGVWIKGVQASGGNDGRLEFYTNNSGTVGERLRIMYDGKILANTSSPIDTNAAFSIKELNNYPLATKVDATVNTQQIGFNNGNGHVGGITTNGSATAFNTSSDYRLKENEVAISDGIERLKQLKPYRFNFKTDADTTLDGFMAHEVSSIVPEAITGSKDETETKKDVVLNANGTMIYNGVSEQEHTEGKEKGSYPSDSTWIAEKEVPVYQSIDQAKLVPLLTSALQEAITKIETLEAKVAALESA